jgi:hypothetical protein
MLKDLVAVCLRNNRQVVEICVLREMYGLNLLMSFMRDLIHINARHTTE